MTVWISLGSLALVCIIIGIVWGLLKTKVDDIQEVAAKVGAVLEHDLGLEGAADLCYKVAAGNIMAVRYQLRKLWEKYGSPTAIDNLVVRIILKALPKVAKLQEHKVAIAQAVAAILPGQLDDKDTDDIIQKVIIERILGKMLTPELRRDLATLGPLLSEYGSIQFANLVTSFAVSDDPEVIRSSARELVNILRNRDQLDDELVKRAIKGIPRAIQADPRHWSVLNDVIQAAKPASAVATEGAAK